MSDTNDWWISNLSGGMSAVAKIFVNQQGSGYKVEKEENMIAASRSPLVCPNCGQPCAGTAERKHCASCGFSSVPQQTTKTPTLGVVENPCPTYKSPLTIVGDRRSCHACGYAV
jgi:ribosomal protein S27AE